MATIMRPESDRDCDNKGVAVDFVLIDIHYGFDGLRVDPGEARQESNEGTIALVRIDAQR